MKNFFVLFLLSLVVMGCEREEPAPAVEVVRPVITYTIPDIMRAAEWTTSGVAKDALETALSFRVSGTIVDIPVNVGQKVQTGQLIARLDAADFNLALRESQAQLKDLQAEMQNAKLNYERLGKLVEQAVVSRSEYDTAVATYNSMQARVAAQKEQIAIARQNLGYTRLVAPVNGVIATVPAEKHQFANAGQAIATLNSSGKLEIEVGMPDRLIPYVSVSDKVLIRFDVMEDVELHGSIKEVGVQAQDATTYPVTIGLEEEDKRIRSGMTGEVTFSFEEVEMQRAVTVPAVAVFGRPDGRKYVWVVDVSGRTVQSREVSVGYPMETGLMIKGGLEPRETVVIRGVHSLKDGQNVRVQ